MIRRCLRWNAGNDEHVIDPHQPFDPVKPACQRLFQNIAPDAARAIGPVAGLEACLDRHHELGIMDLSGAARTIELGVEAGPRHIQPTRILRRLRRRGPPPIFHACMMP